MCEDREGTSGVEADAPNGMDIDVVLSHGFFDAVTDAAPDICGRLFLWGVRICLRMCLCVSLTYIVAGLWLPETDVLRCQPDDITRFIDNTCSRTACTDIDTDVVVLLNVYFVSDISGALPARRFCAALSWSKRHRCSHG